MRLYQLLLHLYPASFRQEYGEEMQAVFRARVRDTAGLPALFLLTVETVVDVVRNALPVHWDILRQDLRYTTRALLRTPAFTLTAVLVTALGIGANTAAFSIVDFVFLRPLPYAQADRLVHMLQRTPNGGTNELSPALYRDWKTSATSFAAMGAYYGSSVNLVGQGDPERLERAVVTADLLPMLGVPPTRGRLFTRAEEQQGTTTIVLSYGLWQAHFAADENIIGRRLLLDGTPGVVIGVMPPDFQFPTRDVALWTLISPAQQSDDDRSNTYWHALARLRSGVTVEQARSEMQGITRRLATRYPQEFSSPGVAVTRLHDEFSTQSRLLLLALAGAAVCVLLIACANLANLLLARALVRRKELLVRAALGAGRERLVRQCITESLVLAALGGAVGVALAFTALPLLARLVPTTLPIADAPGIDTRILLFALGLTAVTGLGFGVLPAWRSAAARDLSGLREGARTGGRRERARSVLVIAEVMTSVVLLVSAGLLLRALLRLENTDPGFRTENVLTVRTALPVPKYDPTVRRAEFYQRVLEGTRAIAGVTGAAYITGLPMAMGGGIWRVVPEDHPELARNAPGASSRFVTPGFFSVMGMVVKQGRDISETDGMHQSYVAVVSESFVKRFWPGQDPIGKRFRFLNDVRTVVGVVGDVRVRGPERTSEPQVYLSYKQVEDGESGFYYPKELVIRSSVAMATLVPAVRRIVQQVDPEQPVSNIRLLSEVVGDVTRARSVQVRVLSVFAAIAFVLAASGIHGLLAFSVSQRQREIGVRIALGAGRGEIIGMVLRHGAWLSGAGVVPGLLVAYGVARAMSSLLAGIKPGDALTFLAAGVLCVVMTLVGSLMPVLRAVRIDPAVAFRAEV